MGADPLRQKSRVSDAVWTAFTEALRFVVVPLVLINLITTNYPLLTTPFMPYLHEYVTFFGGMIVAASTLEAMNKPGTYKRLLFGMSAMVFVGMWMYVIFGGGIAEFTYGPYHVRFDITKIVYIMIAGISLKALLVIATFTTNKPILEQQERQKRIEKVEEKRAFLRAKAAVRTRTPSMPSFDSLSKVAFHVTSDDAVGYSPPPPPPPEPSPASTASSAGLTVRSKVCPICGERAPGGATECLNCGAWFSKESFRFTRGP